MQRHPDQPAEAGHAGPIQGMRSFRSLSLLSLNWAHMDRSQLERTTQGTDFESLILYPEKPHTDSFEMILTEWQPVSRQSEVHFCLLVTVRSVFGGLAIG